MTSQITLKNCTTFNTLRRQAQDLVLESIDDALDFLNDTMEEDHTQLTVDHIVNHSALMMCNLLFIEDQDPAKVSETMHKSMREVIQTRLKLSLDLGCVGR